MNPLVSIITVVLNGARHLEQAIQSVLAQTYPNIEYIIIDGGSTDGTLDIIRRYEDRIEYWISEPDDGIYPAMNKGIARASGDLIGILNSDDFFQEDAVTNVVDALRRHPGSEIFYSDYFSLHDDIGLKYLSVSHMRYWTGMPLCHETMFVKKRVYDELGGYSLLYKLAADYDFLLRAIKKKTRFYHIAKPLLNYRHTGLTQRCYGESMREAKEINRLHLGVFTLKHFAFRRVYARSLVNSRMRAFIARVFGAGAERSLRRMYLRRSFGSRDRGGFQCG